MTILAFIKIVFVILIKDRILSIQQALTYRNISTKYIEILVNFDSQL